MSNAVRLAEIRARLAEEVPFDPPLSAPAYRYTYFPREDMLALVGELERLKGIEAEKLSLEAYIRELKHDVGRLSSEVERLQHQRRTLESELGEACRRYQQHLSWCEQENGVAG